MKIRRIQIVMEPAYHPGSPEDYKIFSVEVRTDCGEVFRSQEMFHESNFKDLFSFIMKDAEKRIRDMVAYKTTT